MNSYLSKEEISKIGFNHIGVNVKISRFAQIYGSKHISVSDNSRIDDFVIISTQSESFIGKNVHIGAGTFISAKLGIYFGDYSGVSSKCSLYGDSDDYSGDFMANPTFSEELRKVTSNQLIIERFALIGANSIMVPHSSLKEGSVLGALSLLNKTAEPWTIYVGNPARAIKARSDKMKNLVADI